MSIYNQPIRNKKLFMAVIVAAVLVMFVLRGILLRQGKVGTPSALSPDQIQQELQKTEINVRTGSAQGHGTVLQMNRQDRKDVFYVVTAGHLRGDAGETLQITDSKGSAFTGDVRSDNTKKDFLLVRCEGKALESVRFSEDLYYQTKQGDTVYYLKSDGTLAAGTVLSASADVEGIGSGMLVIAGDAENGMSGGGVYNSAGYYLGMISAGTDEGTIACVPGNVIVDAFRKAR